jgi:hypothetical protein
MLLLFFSGVWSSGALLAEEPQEKEIENIFNIKEPIKIE